eukprot:scaffold13277_cov35-Tisochrysis_lutea.AAC.2
MITTLDRRALRAPELGENRLGLEVPYAATLHDLRRGDALGIGRSVRLQPGVRAPALVTRALKEAAGGGPA